MENKWPFEKLKKLSERVSVGHVGPTSEFFCEQDVGVPLIRSQNVRPGKLILSDTKYILPSFHRKLKKSTLKGGDVLVVRVGQNRGDCCIVPQYLGDLNCANVVFIRPNKIIPKFLELYLRSPLGQHALLSVSTGSAQAVLNTKSIAEVLAPVPPIPEQKAIVHVLGTLDDRIELNRRMNETLEAMAQALFKSWFVDFDPVMDNALANGKEIPEELSEKAQARAALGDKRRPLPEEIRTLFPDEFMYSEELGWIPKGWEVSVLKNLTTKIGSGATPRGGQKVYREKGTALIRSQNVYDSLFVWSGLARISEEAAMQLSGVTVEEEDVLLNITGASILRTCVVIPDVLPARVNQHVAIIRAKPSVPSRYLHLHLLQQRTKDYLMGLNAGGSREAVTKGHIESVPVLYPNQKLLKHFHNFIEPISSKTNQLEKAIRTLSSTRETLLPKLLSGELRIPDAEKMVEELDL